MHINKQERVRPVRVLIIDDEPAMANELEKSFKVFAELSSWPEQVQRPTDLVFEVDWCGEADSVGDFLKGSPRWDAFVIDRKFRGQYMAEKILLSLQELQVPGMRIVWTAYMALTERSGDDYIKDLSMNVVNWMRLGAWDCIDKKRPRYGDTFTDVVVSVVQGLQWSKSQMQKAEIDSKGHDFVVKNYGEIYKAHKGNFVAFERDANDQWKTEAVASSPSLLGVYLMLAEKQKDRNLVHITLIQE